MDEIEKENQEWQQKATLAAMEAEAAKSEAQQAEERAKRASEAASAIEGLQKEQSEDQEWVALGLQQLEGAQVRTPLVAQLSHWILSMNLGSHLSPQKWMCSKPRCCCCLRALSDLKLNNNPCFD